TNWQAFLDSDLDETTIETLRKHSKTGRPLGDDSFIETVESSAGKTFNPSLSPYDKILQYINTSRL
ncbi:MAG: hypothetical protein R8M45_05655, partial [Ghiorsea sp.]